jgi:hypothetical protein
MSKPFSRIEFGIESARIRQVEWKQVLAHAAPGSPQAARASKCLEFLDLHIWAETRLLTLLRRRWALYEMFPSADKPADLVRQFNLWSLIAPRGQFRLPLEEKNRAK